MKTLEYRTVDKSSWGDGPWQSEPDKKQWRDEATGLPCLIVRNQFGALCGYAGVPKGHRLHGKTYGAEKVFSCTEDRSDDWHHSCTVDSHLEAHGGITFSSSCAPMGLAAHARMRDRLAKSKEEAKVYPKGDAARFIQKWEPVIEDHAAWKAQMEAEAICHVSEAGEPDEVWWFGFDCAHFGDLLPGMAAYMRGDMVSMTEGLQRDDVYRDLGYVEAQISGLAAQLADLAQ